MKEENIYKDAKIVVVDDVESMLNSVKNCLEFEDMKVKTFSDPLDALDYLKNNEADVLLLDFFMPKMNGDEFVNELRKYNKETIIILQTGYSDKIPPLDMIDKMNIQGYLDKNKGEDELLLMTKAAVKTSSLNKAIREKDNQILSHQYKEEFLGRFFNLMYGQVKEKSFAMTGMLEALKDINLSKDDHDKVISNFESEIKDINNLLSSLEIEQEVMILETLKNTLEQLLHIICSAKSTKLNINLINNRALKCNSKNIVYIITDVVDNLMEQNVTEINIDLKADEEAAIVEVDNFVDSEEVDKISRLAKFDENIEITYDNEKLTIKC